MARVFVGIPTYNRPDFVREAIESVRAQRFTDYRVLVSDNCSSPDAAHAVRRFVTGLRDPRFEFHQQTVNEGEYGQGRLFMARSAGADFIVMLHDDDILGPEYLAAGVGALDETPEADLFAANFYMMNTEARKLEELTAWRQRHLGRVGTQAGLFDVRTRHVMTGFTPITGTLFRRRSLVKSGFADPGKTGNYPFECDVFLRLGDIEAKGWFDAREMVGVRDHPGSLKYHLTLMDNPHIVTPMLELFARRRFDGVLERRRRVLVSRLARADALIRLRRSDIAGFRRMLRLALRENPRSARAWMLALIGIIAPDALRRRLPPVQVIRDVGEKLPPDTPVKQLMGVK
jgi:glycosyltransferase involved in cell wall biosynthesis